MKGVPTNEGRKRGTSLKRRYSTSIGSSNVKKWLQIDTDMLLIMTSTGNELLRIVNIDDLD